MSTFLRAWDWRLLISPRFSNSQSVLLASAVRIAQSLGLHRLGRPRRTLHERSSESMPEVIQKELGRRVWQQLVTQDWFSVPFSETYCQCQAGTRSRSKSTDLFSRCQPFAVFYQNTLTLWWRDYATGAAIDAHGHHVWQFSIQGCNSNARLAGPVVWGPFRYQVWANSHIRQDNARYSHFSVAILFE